MRASVRIPTVLPMRIHVARNQPQSVSGHGRRARSALLLLAAAAAIAPIVAVPAANAADSGSNTSTVEITPALVRSITVSPDSSSFGHCTDGAGGNLSTLTVPDGRCGLGTVDQQDYVTVTNGPVAGQVYVNGAAAVAATGSGWTLGAPAGPDRFAEATVNKANDAAGVFMSTTPGCDGGFNGSVTASDCAAPANASSDESLLIVAPTSSTATATTLTITTTWTAVP